MKLRGFAGNGFEGFNHWCPGCREAHSIRTKSPAAHPLWSFDGNMEAPTFHPSVRHFWPAHRDEDGDHPEKTICHYWIKAGQIEFCGDCQHDLSGKTVPLPDFPTDPI